jgi:RNA polymerase sigma-70 factor (ECF subfamily)
MQELSRTDILNAEIVELIPALRAFSRRFHRNINDADDLVQETLVKALGNIERFEEGTRLKSWLFTIMRNAFCSRFAVARREAPGVSECVADSRVVEASQEWTVLVQDVSRAYGELPSYYRDVLDAVAINGQSYEDAAIRFNCAVGTVKSRLNRARCHLVAQFGDLSD